MRMSLFYESGCSYRHFTYFFKSAYCGAIHGIRGKSANRSVGTITNAIVDSSYKG